MKSPLQQLKRARAGGVSPPQGSRRLPCSGVVKSSGNHVAGDGQTAWQLRGRHAPGTRIAGQRRGFTMLELLLVLVVVTLLAAIAFPLLAGSYDRYKLQEQVEVARTQLARARLHAIDTGVAYQFRYEPDGQNFIVVPFEVDSDIQESGEATGDGESITARYPLVSMKLPKGYTFAHDPDLATQMPRDNEVVPVPDMILQALPDARGLTGTSWSAPIVFRPEGEAEAMVFSFIVKDEQKRFIRLTVRPLTGAISVGKVEQGR